MEDSTPDKASFHVFELNSLLEEQITKLELVKPALKKTVVLDGNPDRIVIEPGDVKWEEILRLFFRADISSPELIGIYQIDESDSSGIHIQNYVKKPDEKGDITDFTILKYPEGSLEIHAHEIMENPISLSNLKMTLCFRMTESNDLLLSDYQIRGFQKMILKDTVFYTISGKLIFNTD